METIRYGSADDLKTKVYTAGNLPTTEVDAIVLKDVDIPTETTNAYISPNVTSVGGNTQATLYINFTKGGVTSCTIKVYGGYEGNPDATNAAGWFSESSETDSSGALTLNPVTIVLTATAKLLWHFPIGACRAYKITVLSTGGSVTTDALSLAVAMRSN